MSKITNVKLLLIITLTKSSPGQNVSSRYLRINIENFSSNYTYETAHPQLGYLTADLAFFLSIRKASKRLGITAFTLKILLAFHECISSNWCIFTSYPVTLAEDFFPLNDSID